MWPNNLRAFAWAVLDEINSIIAGVVDEWESQSCAPYALRVQFLFHQLMPFLPCRRLRGRPVGSSLLHQLDQVL